MDLTRFEPYRELIDDWDAFAAIQECPLRPTIWTNTLRLTPEELLEYLDRGTNAEPIPWLPGAFRLPADASPGKSLGRLLGLFHIQEEVSMIPIHLLDPQPGERFLDLCAAPGNKTVQAAVRMENRGTVIANDLHPKRIGLIHQSLERLGITIGAVLHYDAGNLPRDTGLFDRVLADVPCTCEGTVRKNPEVLRLRAHTPYRHNVQVAVLRKAVQLCKPGGRIVYSTCTYDPEENERVVDEVLRDVPEGTFRLLPARIPGFETSPGLTEWQDRSFDSSLVHTMRVWPHHNDTGGFFIALIEKLGTTTAPCRGSDIEDEATFGEVDNIIDPEPFLTALEERFGIPRRLLADDVVFQSSSKRASTVSRHLLLPPRPPAWSVGMPFFSTKAARPRMSSATARRLGRHATRNVLDLDGAQVDELVTRREVRLTAEQAQVCQGDGYVLPRHRGFVVTVAFFRGDDDGGLLRGAIPKFWAHVLRNGAPADLDDG